MDKLVELLLSAPYCKYTLWFIALTAAAMGCIIIDTIIMILDYAFTGLTFVITEITKLVKSTYRTYRIKKGE